MTTTLAPDDRRGDPVCQQAGSLPGPGCPAEALRTDRPLRLGTSLQTPGACRGQGKCGTANGLCVSGVVRVQSPKMAYMGGYGAFGGGY